MPCGPIDEEKDVPRFLLNDGFERVDQRRRKEPGALCRLEKPEGKETVDALAVARHHEGPFWVSLDNVGRFRRQCDAIGGNEIGKHVLVPALLERVELDRLPQQRIRRLRRISCHIEPSPPLRLHRDIPDGQLDQPIAGLRVEFRPIDYRGFVRIESVKKCAAKKRFVRVAAEANWFLG